MKYITKRAKGPFVGSQSPFIGFSHDMGKVFDEFYDMFGAGSVEPSEGVNLSPAIDLVEDESGYKVEAEMPGLGEEDISIRVDGNVLTIEGEKNVSTKNNKKNYVSREITYGYYKRSLTLPESADTDKARATFKKGMLWVEIPKKTSGTYSSRTIGVSKA